MDSFDQAEDAEGVQENILKIQPRHCHGMHL